MQKVKDIELSLKLSQKRFSEIDYGPSAKKSRKMRKGFNQRAGTGNPHFKKRDLQSSSRHCAMRTNSTSCTPPPIFMETSTYQRLV